MKKIAALLMSTLICSGELLASEPLKVEFYDVQGKNEREVRESLNERGPIGKDGVRYHAYTSWNVSWTYQLALKGETCEIQSLETEPTGTITLPKWNMPDRASKKFQQEWERYSAILRDHENGHYNLAAIASNEIKQRLSGLTSVSGCKALGREIDSKAKAVISEFRAKERAYDATTHHGTTQGAQLSP